LVDSACHPPQGGSIAAAVRPIRDGLPAWPAGRAGFFPVPFTPSQFIPISPARGRTKKWSFQRNFLFAAKNALRKGLPSISFPFKGFRASAFILAPYVSLSKKKGGFSWQNSSIETVKHNRNQVKNARIIEKCRETQQYSLQSLTGQR